MKSLHILLVYFLFSITLSSPSIFAQVYQMDNQTVTDCQGTLYDSGGMNDDYGNGENFTFSICPTPVPVCFNIKVDTVGLETNKDKLFIFSSKDTNTPPTDTFSGNLGNFWRQIEAECITIQFTSDINTTALGWKIDWECFVDECAPMPALPQDCINSIPICQNQYSPNIIAFGDGNIPNEINSAISCLNSGEKNNVWYTFTVLGNGMLNFSIIPNVDTDDYDWSVYNLTNHKCSDIFNDAALEVSCNYSPAQGITGANGLAGNQNELEIAVEEGETYVINVSQFSPSDKGYTINFEPSTAIIFDDEKPSLVGIETPSICATDTLRLLMSENVLCGSINKENVTLLDETGNVYTITDVSSPACKLGAEYDRFFTVTVDPPFSQSGDYRLLLTEALFDLCGNVSELVNDTTAFQLDFSNTFTAVVKPVFLCKNNTPIIEIQGSDTYNIYNGNGVAPENFLASGNNYSPSSIDLDSLYTFYVTQMNGNCESAPQSVQVLVSSGDVADFDMEDNICPTAGETFITATLSSTSTAGGTFSISPSSATIDPTTGEITASTLLPNETYTLTYNSPSQDSDCQVIATHILNISGGTAASISGLENSYCNEDEAILLALSPPNGTLSGPGTDANALTFSPSLAGTGIHTLQYISSSSSSDCDITATFEVVVLSSPNIELLAPSSIGIDQSAEIVFTGSIVENGTVFAWDFGNGTVSTDNNPSAPQQVVWSEEGVQLVTLTVSQANGCSATASANIEVLSQNAAQLPTAFSPNGDGINDEFRMVGQNIKTSSIKVFNRWGKQVFISDDFLNNGWNGEQANFKDTYMGMYFYVLSLTYLDDTSSTIQGNVMVIR